jgi:hypothetical protein
MKGGGLVEGFYTLLFIVAIVGSIVLGGYLAIKFYIPKTVQAAPPPPKPEPQPEPESISGWGSGPWGPDPWKAEYDPNDIPGPPPPKPAHSDNFKPELKLLSARFDPVSKYIQVSFRVNSTGDIPPSKSYSIAYDVMSKGAKLTELSEDEPLTSAEMTGLQQQSLVPVTSAPADVKASELTISGQIHYRENGTVNMGVIGLPVTINVQ